MSIISKIFFICSLSFVLLLFLMLILVWPAREDDIAEKLEIMGVDVIWSGGWCDGVAFRDHGTLRSLIVSTNDEVELGEILDLVIQLRAVSSIVFTNVFEGELMLKLTDCSTLRYVEFRSEATPNDFIKLFFERFNDVHGLKITVLNNEVLFSSYHPLGLRGSGIP